MGKRIHILSNIDSENETANCLNCGFVKLFWDKTCLNWRCDIGRREAYKKAYRKQVEKGTVKKSGGKTWTLYKKDKCERCGFIPEDKCQLDVDHIKGRKIPNPHNPENLRTLCANCHRLVTHKIITF